MSAQSSATVTAAYPYQSIFTWHALADCRPAGVLDGRDQFRRLWELEALATKIARGKRRRERPA
jgi:hypothetical protein